MAQHKDFGRGATRADAVLSRGYTGTTWQSLNDPAPPLPGQRVFWQGPQSLGMPPEFRPFDVWIKGTS